MSLPLSFIKKLKKQKYLRQPENSKFLDFLYHFNIKLKVKNIYFFS